MSDKSDDELRGLFREIGELKEVPLGVAAGMEKTIQGLLQEGKTIKTSWITRNSLALAAGFVAVFALGIALNMDSSPVNNISTNNTNNQNPQNNNDVLTSLGSEVEVSNSPLQQFNSGVDYAKPIVIKDLPFTPISTYSKANTLSAELGNCLGGLGLSETVSFIDNALYNKKGVTVVWSAVDLNSWQISILSQKCEPLDEIFVRKE